MESSGGALSVCHVATRDSLRAHGGCASSSLTVKDCGEGGAGGKADEVHAYTLAPCVSSGGCARADPVPAQSSSSSAATTAPSKAQSRGSRLRREDKEGRDRAAIGRSTKLQSRRCQQPTEAALDNEDGVAGGGLPLIGREGNGARVRAIIPDGGRSSGAAEKLAADGDECLSRGSQRFNTIETTDLRGAMGDDDPGEVIDISPTGHSVGSLECISRCSGGGPGKGGDGSNANRGRREWNAAPDAQPLPSSLIRAGDRECGGEEGREEEEVLVDEGEDGLGGAETGPRKMYVYDNTFNVLPSEVGCLHSLQVLKFFSNEVRLIPREIGGISSLEQLYVKTEPVGMSVLPPLGRLRSLKALELHEAPARPSVRALPSDISQLESLTRLAVCHYGITSVPADIGTLKQLEELDLSFNKITLLPPEIGELKSLKTLYVASNKLRSLPIQLSDLVSLTDLDVAHNKITSLCNLPLTSMTALVSLNAKCNRLQVAFPVPSWIKCNLEGNEGIGSAALDKDEEERRSVDSGLACAATDSPRASLKGCEQHDRSGSRVNKWETRRERENVTGNASRDIEQREEDENASSRLASVEGDEEVTCSGRGEEEGCVERTQSGATEASDAEHAGAVRVNSSLPSREDTDASDVCGKVGSFAGSQRSLASGEGRVTVVGVPSTERGNKVRAFRSRMRPFEGELRKARLGALEEPDRSPCDGQQCQDGGPNSCSSKVYDGAEVAGQENGRDGGESAGPAEEQLRLGRRSLGRNEEAMIPNKRIRRSSAGFSEVARKYHQESFCGFDDRLEDGFHDAGRERPFLSLDVLEKEPPCLDSREVIVVDRGKDEDLDLALGTVRKLLVGRSSTSWGRSEGCGKEASQNKESVSAELVRLHVTILAQFVSDWFGGSDKAQLVMSMRTAMLGGSRVPGSKDCACVCSELGQGWGARAVCGNVLSDRQTRLTYGLEAGIQLPSVQLLCGESVRVLKAQRQSNIVPIGALKYGICRHRAIMLKYLCDHLDPAIPCELVRGYMDNIPHAWNVVLVGGVRMLVDACRPADIRPETNAEYLCRYLPLKRVSLRAGEREVLDLQRLLLHEEIGRGASGAVVYRCTLGDVTVAAKVMRSTGINGWLCHGNKEVMGGVACPQRDFTLPLSELRLLASLPRHPSIVEFYGHHIFTDYYGMTSGQERCSSAPETQNNGRVAYGLMLFMEYVAGGSLEGYLARCRERGDQLFPVAISVRIAREVAKGIAWLHSQGLIHRDIKSSNILVDVEGWDAEDTIPKEEDSESTLDGDIQQEKKKKNSTANDDKDGQPSSTRGNGRPWVVRSVKICDFSTAVHLASSSQMTHARGREGMCCSSSCHWRAQLCDTPPADRCVGTPRWMAPEVLRAMYMQNAYGPQVDIWSFGCLLVELLTLAVPYEGLSDACVQSHIQSGQRPGLPVSLQEWLPGAAAEGAPDQITALVDGDEEKQALRTLIELWHECTRMSPSLRPTADMIVRRLDDLDLVKNQRATATPTWQQEEEVSGTGSMDKRVEKGAEKTGDEVAIVSTQGMRGRCGTTDSSGGSPRKNEAAVPVSVFISDQETAQAIESVA
ncbi:hypothetical protein CBR_g34713 [Chara braunii]|uniref:Protein kinase domain-containing protein n=1 Tax=Chara braunii TaxID=69332 RepID=A0A388JZ08_CHABU|nr:hypothetical protein CBR_g34713 [Chara braunii]|eukprot:GBG63012.1 hypothetical protein CBR_g34713 [Chara braunii]